MAYTDINSEDRLVQATFAGHLEQVLGWDSVYAWNQETFAPDGSRELLAGVLQVIAPLDRWTEKEQTQAEVETFILDRVYQQLPEPPYTADDKQQVAALVYRHIWQKSVSDQLSGAQPGG